MEGRSCFFLAVVLASFISSECQNTDIIILDSRRVRGRTASRPWMYPRGTSVEPLSASGNPSVLCTDSEFPNDLSCDLRTFYISNKWKSRVTPDIYDVYIEYNHPSRRGVTCRVDYSKSVQSNENPLRLSYQTFSCTPSANETRVPPFKMSSVSKVDIILRKPDEIDFSCQFVFANAGRVMKGNGRRRGVSVIKFDYETESCVSPVVIGRRVETTTCDGRRCRPIE